MKVPVRPTPAERWQTVQWSPPAWLRSSGSTWRAMWSAFHALA